MHAEPDGAPNAATKETAKDTLDNNAIFTRILERYETHMTGAEQRIADYLLKNPHESITFSVATLAARAGVSEATVVRFAKTLGYGGFLDFKQELLRRASRDLALPDRYERLAMDSTRNPLAAVADLEVANIAATVAQVDPEAFVEAAAALKNAGVVYTVGSGLSSHLARLATYQLTLVGKRSFALPDSASGYEEQLKLARPGDVLLAFTFPPYAQSVLSLLSFAAALPIETVCITDRRQSPAARLASHTLFAASNNQLPLNSIAASSVLLTALLGALTEGNGR